MDGDQQTSLHIDVRLDSLFRQHMNVRPARIILAAFHERKIEGSMGTSDLGKMRAIPAVPAEEDLGLLPSIIQEHHSVVLRSSRLRPEKCRAGAQVKVIPS